MGKWVQRTDYRLLCARRVENWNGDTGALGEPVPPGTLAALTFDTASRRGKLFAYAPGQPDLIVDFLLNDVHEETPGAFPTGRFDPTGSPTLVFHGGQLKAMVKLWGGGGGAPSHLGRVYTGVVWEP